LKQAKKEYLKYFVIYNFNNITTIKHKDKYKRDYYYDDSNKKSDWMFNNFYFEND
jgi:hypothetical protein